MRNVLLVDGNPDHVRLLSGLFKYRLEPDLQVVGDCVSGLRQIYTQAPDVVLVNALLYGSENFGFPRAMTEGEMNDGIGIVVLVSGQLDEIRERAVKQFQATIVEMPTSAGELKEAMETAQRLGTRSSTPRPVTWQSVDKPSVSEPDSEVPPTVHRVSWQAFDTAAESDEIRPVNWAVDGAGGTPGDGSSANTPREPDPPRPKSRPRPAPRKKHTKSDHIVKEDAEAFSSAFTAGGAGFVPISRPEAKDPDIPAEITEPQPFRPATTRGIPDVDPKKAKN
jgi:hypothetical protein